MGEKESPDEKVKEADLQSEKVMKLSEMPEMKPLPEHQFSVNSENSENAAFKELDIKEAEG